MKSKFHILLIITVLLFLSSVSAYSQESTAKVYGTEGDSTNCPVFLSVYRQFFRLNLYDEAIVSWRQLFQDCPSSSEKMYIDGVTMYRKFIESAPDGPVKEGLVDTLMMIYDQRMEYFGGEGNVLGRKGRDLLAYRKSDIGEVQKAYEMLKRSVELEGKESQEAVMVLLISSGITLYKEKKIENGQVMDDYVTVLGILDQMEGNSSVVERTRTAVDEMILKEDILSCEALDSYFGPQLEQKKEDAEFLQKAVQFYGIAGCERSDLFAIAAENLYAVDPGPTPAHNLAVLFIARNDYKKAAEYLKLAVVGEGIDDATRAEWYFELALVSNANKNYCESIEYAREAISLKSNYGKAYVLLADSYIASRDNLGEDFEQRTAFWAAADKYERAASVDPSVAEEANQKLADYAGQYPNHEEIFFRDLKEGDTYRVAGCINENTTVRTRD
jgi:hypothetical protein